MKRIALIGLDGSGKSANIDIMKKDDVYSMFEFVWVRWKPTLLKPLYRIMGSRVNKAGNTEKQDISTDTLKTSEEQKRLQGEYNKKSGLKKRIFKSSVVRRSWIFLATFDYFFQFYFKVLGKLIKKKSIIFDRYYLDLYVDQGINFGYTPNQVKKEIKRHQWLFPKMEKIIYIKVSPETCYRRKDDIPNMDYLVKRYEIYECLSTDKNWVVIDGEQTLFDVNNEIKKQIVEK